MFEQTIQRLFGLEEIENPLIVCNNEHRFMVAEQLQGLGILGADIVLEPFGKNTAPAIAVAAIQAMKNNDDPILLVLSADHIIENIPLFHQAIKVAQEQASLGHLVTFGIVPSSAHTGYGYIEVNEKNTTSTVNAFIEKPNLETAIRLVESGTHYWNSGMFMFKASVFLKELEIFSPEIVRYAKQAVEKSVRDLDFIRLNAEAFEQCPSDSIDYAVMEKTNKAWVVPLDAGWNDVGSWSSLWECSEKDDNNNFLKGDVIVTDVCNAYIHSDHRLVSVVGLTDVVVIETADAILVAHKDRVQDVKTIVDRLKLNNRMEADNHRLCYRPWGHYDSVDEGNRFQVKRITVKPGASLSLQLHHHRAEHWVVVKGTAEVTCDDKVSLLSENESTYIPVGKTHRLRNPGRVPLEIIEIQSGSYLGEDDIVRFDDQYDRC
jgi:mannose-1-phosphate guanylyltransferase/mannose-6-phosphate isomerase